MKQELKLVSNGQTILVSFSKVFYLEANGSYTNVCYLDEEKKLAAHLCSRHLNFFGRQLDERFLRIHRSTIANLDKVVKIIIRNREVVLKKPCGETLTVARKQWKRFRQMKLKK